MEGLMSAWPELQGGVPDFTPSATCAVSAPIPRWRAEPFQSGEVGLGAGCRTRPIRRCRSEKSGRLVGECVRQGLSWAILPGKTVEEAGHELVVAHELPPCHNFPRPHLRCPLRRGRWGKPRTCLHRTVPNLSHVRHVHVVQPSAQLGFRASRCQELARALDSAQEPWPQFWRCLVQVQDLGPGPRTRTSDQGAPALAVYRSPQSLNVRMSPQTLAPSIQAPDTNKLLEWRILGKMPVTCLVTPIRDRLQHQPCRNRPVAAGYQRRRFGTITASHMALVLPRPSLLLSQISFVKNKCG
ncbi:hypothetical protein VTI74DRAFT_369 [Chaetomium olivicolor]